MSLPASEAQQNYLEILFLDCNFTRKERKAFLRDLFHRDIAFLDELTIDEASIVIRQLKEQKETKQERAWEKKRKDQEQD